MMHKIRVAIFRRDNKYLLKQFDSQTVKGIIQKNIAKNTTMLSDEHKTYKALEKEFEKLNPAKAPSNQAHIKLPERVLL